MKERPRLAVISALGVVQILTWGTSYYLLTVLAPPIAADTGWPLPWIVGSLSASLLVSGLVSPRVGHTIGQAGGRSVLALATVILALGLLVLGLAPNLPVFFLGWLILGVGMGAGLYDAAFATLGRLYGASARPAISTLTLWGGFASTVCWPLSAFLVAHLGWRGTCFAYAGLLLVLALPLILLVLPAPSPLAGVDSATSTSTSSPLAARERRAFLLLAGILTLGGATTAIISVHLLNLLQAQGASLATAVSLGALVGPSQVAARVIEMANKGRHHPIWTLTAATGLIALGLVLLLTGFPILALALVLYGAGNGVYSIARGTLPLALFGPARYAPLLGRLALPNLVAQALAPSLGALVLAQGGVQATLTLLVILALLNFALVGALWQAR
ncbi:MFS transporter [Methylobacterium nonmethylotrophicum]|uniref:MFS transporter n=1 Tax=Methylobacterium nonmethylotrophicum TaxID=1141884 RepID=A0A4Z0NE79_9HYPH|nr:MFS transporter [Methylobacterium nonmethylotrophicum]TGD94578.1 MFS transporter [Methylobacterium nonmethylotrophicum]